MTRTETEAELRARVLSLIQQRLPAELRNDPEGRRKVAEVAGWALAQCILEGLEREGPVRRLFKVTEVTAAPDGTYRMQVEGPAGMLAPFEPEE